MTRFSCYITILLTISIDAFGQSQSNPLKVTFQNAITLRRVPFVNTLLQKDSIAISSDADGNLTLGTDRHLPITLLIKQFGYQDTTIQITKETSKILLQPKPILLEEVQLTLQSESQALEMSGYSINSISIEEYANSAVDLNQILNQTAGVNIRETGGVGSDFEVSLNGLSGKQIKIFIDGIPMDYMGTSLSINNIPINMIERIDVFKGVVPIKLGADALGGAINIITKDSYQSFIDGSYSYGSFNTHKVSLHGQYMNDSIGYFMNTNFFLNHSDNNYKIDAAIPNYSTGRLGEVQTYERFHSDFSSIYGQIKIGVLDKSYADKLVMNVSLSNNEKEIQHATSIAQVFGEVESTDQAIIPTIEYIKSNFIFNGLDLKAYTGYIERKYSIVDTASRTYFWDGSYQPSNPGESNLLGKATLFKFTDRSYFTVLNSSYHFNSQDKISFNYTLNSLERQGKDFHKKSDFKSTFEDPNSLNKHVFGFSLDKTLFNDKISTNIFLKYYNYRAEVIEEIQPTPQILELKQSFYSNLGYGTAFNFNLSRNTSLKLNYEHAYRFPEGYELFGDGLLLKSNTSLNPEHSDNVNTGITHIKSSKNSQFQYGGNIFFRVTENLIRIQPIGINRQYVNQRDVNTTGVEIETVYQNKNWLAGVNLTFQNLINEKKYENGFQSQTYKDRIPNTPYFFTNANLSYKIPEYSLKKSSITFSWSGRYVHEYYLFWPSLGASETKHIIPSQLSMNIETTLTFNKGNYNLSLECRNFMNAKTYDNFQIEKPGRAYYLKLRYYWNK